MWMHIYILQCQLNYSHVLCTGCGPHSSVSIATGYELDGPGIDSWWGQDFPPIQTGPGAHPASCTMGTGSFPGVKCGWGMLLTTNPLLVPRSWMGRAIPLPPLGHNRACNGVTLPLPFTLHWLRINLKFGKG
jgi:hypothetical protein